MIHPIIRPKAENDRDRCIVAFQTLPKDLFDGIRALTAIEDLDA